MSNEVIELAWAAGFIDGEGCFSIRSTKVHPSPLLRLSVSQSDRRPLDRLEALVGPRRGKVNGPYQHPTDPLRKKPTYQWSLTGKLAVEFYGRLKPYMSEPKIELAEIALDKIRVLKS